MSLSLPKTIVGGTPENGNDVQTNDAYLATQIDTTNTDKEFAFSTYKTIVPWVGGGYGSDIPSGTLSLSPGGISSSVLGAAIFYLNPADYTANARTNKYRVRAIVNPNQVAPAITFTLGLYPITLLSPGSSNNANVYAFGTVTAGSTVAIATPSASSTNQSNSGDFTAPAAGFYALGVALSGSGAAGSRADILACVQLRQV